MQNPRLWLFAAVFMTAGGCTQHTIEVKPIKVEPIQVTLDINIRVDRELDEFFSFEDEIDQTMPGASSSGTVSDVGVS
jgi:hypothetical protein